VKNQVPQWLSWAREIQALSQAGAHYAVDNYQLERFSRLSEIAAEIISMHSDLEQENLVNLFKQQTGYPTPRIDVRAAVFKDRKLLLVRERVDGGWTMPGGWADVGDVPSEAAERETFEESGFRVKAKKLIGVYDANRTGPLELFHAFKIIFLCEIIEGEASPSYETTEVAFFGPEEIPELLSGERTKTRQIKDAFSTLADSQMQAVFD
jgi:ADP-ribose pyrophosphatase YjhB (NUDIX family)